MEFKYRIKQLREENRISAADLGKYCNITRYAVSAWETGRSKPSNENLLLLSKLFNCSIDYLLGKSNKRYTDDNLAFYSDLNKLDDDQVKVIESMVQIFKKSNSNK